MAAEVLVHPQHAPAQMLLRDVHVLDPRGGLDERRDVRVRAGQIAELGAPGELPADPEEELLEGSGQRLLPAFFDPHVHRRRPGQEHKEDIETGTRAAAAGGYAAVLAMPNTDPVLDSAPLLRSLRDAAAREARVSVGFLAAITIGSAGERLTEMAELREWGAGGFTDDGRAVRSAGILRAAMQYQRLCGGDVPLHEADEALARGGGRARSAAWRRTTNSRPARTSRCPSSRGRWGPRGWRRRSRCSIRPWSAPAAWISPCSPSG